MCARTANRQNGREHRHRHSHSLFVMFNSMISLEENKHEDSQAGCSPKRWPAPRLRQGPSWELFERVSFCVFPAQLHHMLPVLLRKEFLFLPEMRECPMKNVMCESKCLVVSVVVGTVNASIGSWFFPLLVSHVLSSIIDTGRHGTSWEHQRYRHMLVRSQHEHSYHHRTSPGQQECSPGPEELVKVHASLISGMMTLAYLNSNLHVLIHSLMHVNKQRRRSTQKSKLHCLGNNQSRMTTLVETLTQKPVPRLPC